MNYKNCKHLQLSYLFTLYNSYQFKNLYIVKFVINFKIFRVLKSQIHFKNFNQILLFSLKTEQSKHLKVKGFIFSHFRYISVPLRTLVCHFLHVFVSHTVKLFIPNSGASFHTLAHLNLIRLHIMTCQFTQQCIFDLICLSPHILVCN
jgi:hypothetical protein